MYTIYHIPGVKIGCSNEVENRVKNQGYSHYEILETHNDINIASYREKELQLLYGYEVDKSSYKQVTSIATFESRSRGGKIGGQIGGKIGGQIGGKLTYDKKIGIFGMTEEEKLEARINGGKIGGKISGKLVGNKNKENGHIQEIGKASMSRVNICPYCNKEGKGAIYFRWHGENCKHKPKS
jgi:hypothetical protein